MSVCHYVAVESSVDCGLWTWSIQTSVCLSLVSGLPQGSGSSQLSRLKSKRVKYLYECIFYSSVV